MTTTSALFPALGAGDTVVAIVMSSVGVWIFHLLISRGVKEAAVINRIVTVAKVVPILVFIVLAVILFNGDYFADNLWGGEDKTFSAIFEQAKGTMLITVFVCSSVSKAPASTLATLRSARTSDGPPSSDSSACSGFSRW